MTRRQRDTVAYLFRELELTELHHGDCVGADAQAHKIAKSTLARIVVHPPLSSSRLRSFCAGDESRKPCAFLVRNSHIVKEGIDGLIAAPRESTEQLRSGTWSTIRKARRLGRRIFIVNPDGTFKAEPS